MAFSPRAGAVISFTVEGAQDAQRQIETVGSAFDRMSTVASAGLKVLAAGYAALKISEYVNDATLLAARYETLGIVMHVAGNNAGYTGTQMDGFAKTLQKSGISMIQAREALTQMATAQLDVTKSTELGRLAQNLAVVANKNSSETLKELVTNIQQADTEGLKYMGIVLNQEDALNKYALAHKTVAANLTQTQKAEAIQQAVMREGAKYAGIYEQAMGTAGKALNSLSRYFDDIKVKVGTPFLEGFAQGVFGVTDGVKRLNLFLDDLEKNGAIENFSKQIGSIVGNVISVVTAVIEVIGAMIGSIAEAGRAFAKFFDNYLGGMASLKAITVGFALLLSGFMVEQATIGFAALSASAWAASLKVGSAFLAMTSSVVTFFTVLGGAVSAFGWAQGLLIGARTLVAGIGTAVAAIPGAVGAVAVAGGLALGYVFVKAFGDSISKGIDFVLPQFVTDLVDKGIALIVNKFSDLPEVSLPTKGAPKDNKAAMEAAEERKRKEKLQGALMDSISAASMQQAVVEAANTRMKAIDDLRDQQLKQSLDQRIITQADYLQKKEKMDVAEAQGALAALGAQKTVLAAQMAAYQSGAPGAKGRDPNADAQQMIKLTADQEAAQTKLNTVKQSYAYEIAGALIESYTKEFGSISGIVDAQEQLNRTTRQTYQQAGLTAEQQQIWSAQYLQSSAARLSADQEERKKNGTATDEYLKNTGEMITAMNGLAQARLKAVAPGVQTQFINDAKTLHDNTVALYNEMRDTIVNTDEARIRSAANASIRLAAIRRSDAQDAINASSDTDGDKLAKSFKLLDDYNRLVAEVNVNADAQVLESSDGYRKLSDIMSNAFDPARVQTFGAAMKDAFGTAGEALGGLVDAFSLYTLQQSDNDKARKAANDLYKNDSTKLAAANSAITAKQSKEQLAYYGNMADAAKGFFKEGSTGYRTLQTISQAFHAAEMAQSVAEMVQKLFATQTVTAAKVAGAGEEVAASAATLGPTIAVEGAKSNAYGVSALAASLAAPFPANLAAYATVAAMLAAIGVAMHGGGNSMSVSQQRQEEQGAGTVLGNGSAKSDSINKSIELTAANSSTQINYLSGLLATLKGIQTDINSFAAELVQSTDISNPSVHLNTNNGFASTVGTAGLATGGALLGMTGAAWTAAAGSGIGASALASLGSFAGPAGAIAGALVGAIASKIPVISKLMTGIFGGKQSLQDSGFTLSKTDLATVLAQGVKGLSYADVHTSGGLFSHGSDDETTTSLGAEANQQFTSIIKSLASSITQASSLLGASGDDFTAKLNSFVIDIGNVSLKGLSGDDLQKAVEAVFSKLGDQMAQAAIPDLAQFQQVGEGYLETLVRVASDYAKVDASLQSISMTFGSVGVASIGARENLVSLLGGIDDFQSKTADFATNFLTKAQQLAPVSAFVTQQLGAMNLGWVQTREQFASVVSGLDLTSAAGQQMYASLMNLESAFAATHVAIVDTSKSAQDIADERKDLQDKLDEATMTSTQLLAKQRAAIDASNQSLFDQVQVATARKDLQDKLDALTMTSAQVREKERAAVDAGNLALYDRVTLLQDEKDAAASLLGDADKAFSTLQNVTKSTTDALTKRITAEQALSDAVKSTLSSMTTSTTTLVDRATAQAQIRAAAAAVRGGGDLPTADSLKDALSAVSKDAADQFSSYNDYLKDLYSTKNDLSDLGNLADSSLSVDQKQLDSLNGMLDAAQKQLDVLKGIDTTGLTIAQALAGFQLAVGSAQANPIVSANSDITAAYQTYLHRAPDAAGLAWWQQQAAAGVPISQIIGGISGSSEAMGKVPGFAAGGNFGGGLRLVGENGPELEVTGPSRIFNANQTGDLMSRLTNPSDNSSAMLEELKAMRAEQQATRAELRALREANTAENGAIAKHTLNTADHLDAAINGDTPLATKVIPA